jgi:hypothetical protein
VLGPSGSHGKKVDAPAGGVTMLYAFTGAAEGASPRAALIQASDGSLYGMTSAGGTFNGDTPFGVTPGGTMTTLHAFKALRDVPFRWRAWCTRLTAHSTARRQRAQPTIAARSSA